jgi:hypothetical protein
MAKPQERGEGRAWLERVEERQEPGPALAELRAADPGVDVHVAVVDHPAVEGRVGAALLDVA